MKKYIVRLTDSERDMCCEVIRTLKGTSQKVRRAQMLLKADTGGGRGRTPELPMLFPAAQRPSRMSGKDVSNSVLSKL